MKHRNATAVSRRRLLGYAACTLVAASAAPVLASPARLTGAGDVRTIRMRNPRTGESINSVYWIEGHYVPEVLDTLNFLMRDWRNDQVKQINPALIDIASATLKLLDTPEPFTLYSGYRSPQTNRMLAMRRGGVARDSYHIKGMAADLHLETRSVRQISKAAQRLAAGGVGRYSRSNFVHLDSGPVRDWGR